MVNTSELRAKLQDLHDEHERGHREWSISDCRTSLDVQTTLARFVIRQADGMHDVSHWETEEQAYETLLQAGQELSAAVEKCSIELGWLAGFYDCVCRVGWDAAHAAAVLGDFGPFETLATEGRVSV